MVTLEESIVVHRPLEDVFEYMTRFENDVNGAARSWPCVGALPSGAGSASATSR